MHFPRLDHSLVIGNSSRRSRYNTTGASEFINLIMFHPPSLSSLRHGSSAVRSSVYLTITLADDGDRTYVDEVARSMLHTPKTSKQLKAEERVAEKVQSARGSYVAPPTVVACVHPSFLRMDSDMAAVAEAGTRTAPLVELMLRDDELREYGYPVAEDVGRRGYWMLDRGVADDQRPDGACLSVNPYTGASPLRV